MATRREGEGREEVQRRVRRPETGKSSGWKRRLSSHMTHLRRREVALSSPGKAAGASPARGLCGRGPDRGWGIREGFLVRPADAQ